MSKRLVLGVTGVMLLLLVLVMIVVLVYDNHLDGQENSAGPNFMSSYSDYGYDKIDPETILASLGRGDTKNFVPLLGEPHSIKELTNITINWTQADFLKIAGALGQFVWNDPMDPKRWSVFSIGLDGSCLSPFGFQSASIAYFRLEGGTYITRLIEMEPAFGWVGWGDGEQYPQPILHKWKGVDLSGARVSADDAIRIVGQDAISRFQAKDSCGVVMGSPENNDPENWYLHTFLGSNFVLYVVNLETGHYTVQKPNQ